MLTTASWSQVPKPGKYERCWAVTHPFAAFKVKKITKKCSALVCQIEPKNQLDNFTNGGKLDAYRHSFYMAAYAQKVKTRKLRKLGIAHEKTNYRQFLKSEKEEGELADSLSNVMDLFNNELGLKIGAENKKESLEHLSEIIIEEIKKGNALIVKRDSAGAYLDCDGRLIDLKKYTRVSY